MPDFNSTWEQLSPTAAQVIFCDLQKQIVARSKTTTPDALVKSAGVLLQMAELFSLPVSMSVVPEDNKPPELIPELEREGNKEFLRASASPFFDKATREALQANNRQVLIIAGFSTEVTVLHTALEAMKAGYKTLIAVDASGGLSERTEQTAFQQLTAAGALNTSVVSIATKLAPDFSTEKGKQMFASLQQLRLA